MLAASSAAPTPEAAYRAAHALYDQSKFKETVEAADAALARFGNRDDDAVWELRELRAIALVNSGKWQAVLEAAKPELPPRLRHGEAAVHRLRALAIASYQLSHFDQATNYLDAAERVAAKLPPRFVADVKLARASMQRAPFTIAVRERAARDALGAARRAGDLTLQGKAIGTLSLILASEERFDEAVDVAEETSRIAAKIGNEALIQRTEGNLGWYYNMLGDQETAAEHLQKAIALCVKLGADANRITNLLLLGDTERSRGDFVSARRHYNEAHELAVKTDSPDRGGALVDLADLALRSGDINAARRYNDQARSLTRKANEKSAIFEARLIEARIASMSGQLDRARTMLEAIIGEAKSKSILWQAHARLAEVRVALHDNRRAEEQFQEALEKTEEARDIIQEDEHRLSFLELSKELNDAYVDFLMSNNRVRDALRIAEWNRARTLAGGREETFDPERVAREAGLVVLSYWLAPRRSFVWVIKSGGVESFVLPPSGEIESAIDSYQSALAGPRGTLAGSGDAGKRLYKMLVEPAAQSLRGATRLAVIPDGRIASFNLETIVVPDPRPHYWIEDVTIRRAPSLQLLARAVPSRSSSRILVIGAAPQADPDFPKLRHAEAEIERVCAHFPGATTLTGARATPRAYLASAPESYAFLHFVAHAVAARLQPLDSAVILGPDRDGYKLYARDIARHPLRARLVTISSCHGAGRRAFAGEGLVGLAWAFLRAGAHEVIAALWEVNDEASPDFMDAMYGAIRAGRDPADALRAAKLKMLRSNTIYRKPLYWAPFVLYSRS